MSQMHPLDLVYLFFGFILFFLYLCSVDLDLLKRGNYNKGSGSNGDTITKEASSISPFHILILAFSRSRLNKSTQPTDEEGKKNICIHDFHELNWMRPLNALNGLLPVAFCAYFIFSIYIKRQHPYTKHYDQQHKHMNVCEKMRQYKW